MARFWLFWSAYSPLFLLFAIKFTSDGLRIVMAVLCVGAVLALWLELHRGRQLEGRPYELASVSDEGGAVAGYLVAYILPFVAAPDPTTRDLVAYAVFLVLLAVVHVRTPLVQVNPLLYLFGLRVFAVQTTTGLTRYLICDRAPLVGDRMHAVWLSESVLKATVWNARARG